MSRFVCFALLFSFGLVLALALPHPQEEEAATSAPDVSATTPASGGNNGNNAGFSPEQCKQFTEQCSSNQNNINSQQQQVNSTMNGNQDQMNPAGQMGNMTNNTPVGNMTQVPAQPQVPQQPPVPNQNMPEICSMAGIEQYCAMVNQQQQITNPMGMANQTQINNFAPQISTPMPMPMGK